MKSCIAVIGAGRVGATTAYTLILKNLVSELLLVDIDEDKCEGEVRDLADTLAFCETALIKKASIEDARKADIIVIAAGKAQKPEETRLDLIPTNKKIVESIVKGLEPINPNAIILVITNPVDLMTLVAQKASSLPQSQVFGSGTWLDTQRLRRYLAKELDIAPESIEAFVVGEHGDSQFVPWAQVSVGGMPIEKICIDQKILDEIAEKTKKEAYIIIEKKCATYYGIAACIADICEMIIFNQKKIVPISGRIPELDVCLSMPVVLGKNGIERSIAMSFNENEKEILEETARRLKKSMQI